jgi:hypothetical protein
MADQDLAQLLLHYNITLDAIGVGLHKQVCRTLAKRQFNLKDSSKLENLPVKDQRFSNEKVSGTVPSSCYICIGHELT